MTRKSYGASQCAQVAQAHDGVPTGAVTGVGENGIRLNIARQQVKDLPSGSLGHAQRVEEIPLRHSLQVSVVGADSDEHGGTAPPPGAVAGQWPAAAAALFVLLSEYAFLDTNGTRRTPSPTRLGEQAYDQPHYRSALGCGDTITGTCDGLGRGHVFQLTAILGLNLADEITDTCVPSRPGRSSPTWLAGPWSLDIDAGVGKVPVGGSAVIWRGEHDRNATVLDGGQEILACPPGNGQKFR